MVACEHHNAYTGVVAGVDCLGHRRADGVFEGEEARNGRGGKEGGGEGGISTLPCRTDSSGCSGSGSKAEHAQPLSTQSVQQFGQLVTLFPPQPPGLSAHPHILTLVQQHVRRPSKEHLHLPLPSPFSLHSSSSYPYVLQKVPHHPSSSSSSFSSSSIIYPSPILLPLSLPHTIRPGGNLSGGVEGILSEEGGMRGLVLEERWYHPPQMALHLDGGRKGGRKKRREGEWEIWKASRPRKTFVECRVRASLSFR